MIDATKLRTGTQIKLVSGETLTVQGFFMGSDGLMVSAKPDPGRIYERNVPVAMIETIIDEVK